MCGLLVVALQWGGLREASAQTADLAARITYSNNTGRVLPAIISKAAEVAGVVRAFNALAVAGVRTGAVAVVDSFAACVGTVCNVAMQASRTVPWSSVALGAARALPYVGAGLAVGGAVYTFWHGLGCEAIAGDLTQIKCDWGNPPGTVTMWKSTNSGVFGTTCVGFYSAGEVYICELGVQKTLWAASNPTYTWYPLTRSQAVALGAPDGGALAQYACAKPGGAPANWGDCNLRTLFNSGATNYSGIACPAGNGSTYRYELGGDGKCRKVTMLPAPPAFVDASPMSPESAAGHIADDQTAKNGAAAAIADASGVRDLTGDAGPPVLTGPASVAGTPVVVNGPGGTTTTTPGYSVTYEGDTFTWNSVSNITQSGTAPPPAAAEPVETCGLPGKPKCVMDETGTPTAGNLSAADAALAAAQAARVTELSGPAHAQGSLGWNFSLSLPVGTCSAFQFVSRIGTLTADPCGSSGVALWRSLLAWFVAAMTGLYIWRSATDALA